MVMGKKHRVELTNIESPQTHFSLDFLFAGCYLCIVPQHCRIVVY